MKDTSIIQEKQTQKSISKTHFQRRLGISRLWKSIWMQILNSQEFR
jgi:hypothetical protein